MELKDPKAMRALAHPLRIQLFELLAIEGEATATRLSELVDESPANCSFHLRTLAKFGYIERVPGTDGRERPWRVVDVEQTWDTDQPDSDRQAAADQLDDAFLEWDTARMKAAARRPVPDEWKGKLFYSGATLWLTPDEARSVGDEIGRIVARYVDRWNDAEGRPADGRPVRLIASSFLVPHGDHQ